MKHQALFSLTVKSKKKNKNFLCCNFAWLFKGLTTKTGNLPMVCEEGDITMFRFPCNGSMLGR